MSDQGDRGVSGEPLDEDVRDTQRDHAAVEPPVGSYSDPTEGPEAERPGGERPDAGAARPQDGV
jgi:hypothetical protein